MKVFLAAIAGELGEAPPPTPTQNQPTPPLRKPKNSGLPSMSPNAGRSGKRYVTTSSPVPVRAPLAELRIAQRNALWRPLEPLVYTCA